MPGNHKKGASAPWLDHTPLEAMLPSQPKGGDLEAMNAQYAGAAFTWWRGMSDRKRAALIKRLREKSYRWKTNTKRDYGSCS